MEDRGKVSFCGRVAHGLYLFKSFFFGLDQRFGIDATWFCKGRGDIQLIAGLRQVNG